MGTFVVLRRRGRHVRRRNVITLVLVLCAAAIGVSLSPLNQRSGHAAVTDPSRYVDPFIGTANSASPDPVPGGAGGATYPGAMYPFGMAQFSPDTSKAASKPGERTSGYHREDEKIDQFSLTHFSGAGCPNGENIAIMPSTTASFSEQNSPGNHWSSYAATKGDEEAKPGYYKVTLKETTTQTAAITAELGATQRTAAARLTFPKTATAQVLVNPSTDAHGNSTGGEIAVDGDEISGKTYGGDFCTRPGAQRNVFPIYFVLRFDRTPTASGTWKGDEVRAGGAAVQGQQTGAYVTFDTTGDQTVTVAVGLSFVSAEGARQNLAKEQPADSTFDKVRDAADRAWDTRLNSVQVNGGSDDDLTKFYTALYHTMLAPNVSSDVSYVKDGEKVDAKYAGFDNGIHTVPDGMSAVYQNFSGWDIYRSWAALAALVVPDVMTDVVRSMIIDGEQGYLLPNWSQQNTETYAMKDSDPGPIVVSSAYAFGIRDFDTAKALKLMKRNASGESYASGDSKFDADSGFDRKPIRDEHGSYNEYGYVKGRPSTTLEYAASDFAIAAFAQALNDDDSGAFMQRAQNWARVFNSTSGYIQPRWEKEEWKSPLDPADHRNFNEGNASQYTWMVPFNYQSLFDLMGGPATGVQRLDQHFTRLNVGIGQAGFYIGNEPGHNVPWAYNFAAAPAKTSEVVRRVMNEFTTDAGGLPGNDDLGSTSAWYVWAAMGMYPVTPGADTLALHGPLFPSVLIQPPGERKSIQITGSGAKPNAPYVHSLSVNGATTTDNFIRYQDIADGGTLAFTMSSSPSTVWGTAAGDVPPSFTDGFTKDNPRPTAAEDLGPNLAQGRTTSGSASCDASHTPTEAVDGSLDSSWCSTASSSYLQVDLGSVRTVSSFVVKHAGLGGQSTVRNTNAFTIQTSTDGTNFDTSVTVSGSSASRTHHPLKTPVSARYVKLTVSQPTQPNQKEADGTSRIQELEVYAPLPSTPPHPPTPTTTTAGPTPTPNPTTAGPTPTPNPTTARRTPPSSPAKGDGAQYLLMNRTWNKCINAAFDQRGSNAEVSSCNRLRPSNQLWAYTSRMELQNGTQCLEASRSRQSTAVILGDCGRSEQQWTFESDGTIRSQQLGLCLDLNAQAAGGDRIPVVLKPCDPRNFFASQQWAVS
ncbi:GH92 family glycosyl hydrolase [Streptomyces sp. NPDC059015]|uniref:GH92 family glycosyl hydrolase n=1 Tax=unclassified Streptomyces TaxID=2593676 RepID=UPI00367F0358